MPASLRLHHLTLEWGRRTYLMGIINVTPDSFSGDGVMDVSTAVAQARQMLADGADIIDVGGESTRPGASPVPLEEELRRVIPVVTALIREGAAVSVDTMKSEVARRALETGAAMINDVSALRADPGMPAIVAEHASPVVLMHGYGDPAQASSRAARADIISEILKFLRERIDVAVAAGIPRDHILVDPGFGFGKSVQQNLDVVRRLSGLRAMGRPIVIGPSRKGTIGHVLGGLPVGERLEGTAAAVAVSIVNGADVVRVHDVRAMARVARMADAIVRQERPE